MAKTDSLFGATYQQSRQIFSLDNLKDGGGFGQAGRVELRYRVWILLSVGMFFSVMIWMFGSELGGMATDAAAHPGDVHYITNSCAIWMGRCSGFMVPVFKVWFVMFEAMLVINVLWPKPLPMQLLFVQVLMMVVMLPMLTIIILPLSLGGTLVSLGWLGAVVVVLLGVIFLVVQLMKGAQDTRVQLYGKTGTRQLNFGPFDYWTWRIGGGLLVVSLINGFTFRLGFPRPATSNFWTLLVGLVPIFYFALFALLIRALFAQIVSNFYLWKYGHLYQADYHISDKLWYGWLKAKHLAKRRAKQAGQS
ncbi:hypothetical protein [Lacticaseibacillus nasuensis]|uniref:Uncharacterized protein n=2 Tax=Lacticaseibacillus TaxID=2759736 RepID=A0A0R1JHU6_9LACO|nr:hypothetical protein [Lacticaseibacillus nasuensis]KRK70885.1 hypothetical protein FD02_GL000066 [Lacticaseibacillus nasuensis JCM 17158]